MYIPSLFSANLSSIYLLRRASSASICCCCSPEHKFLQDSSERMQAVTDDLSLHLLGGISRKAIASSTSLGKGKVKKFHYDLLSFQTAFSAKKVRAFSMGVTFLFKISCRICTRSMFPCARKKAVQLHDNTSQWRSTTVQEPGSKTCLLLLRYTQRCVQVEIQRITRSFAETEPKLGVANR